MLVSAFLFYKVNCTCIDLVSDALKYLISKLNFLEHHYTFAVYFIKQDFFLMKKLIKKQKLYLLIIFVHVCTGTYF